MFLRERGKKAILGPTPAEARRFCGLPPLWSMLVTSSRLGRFLAGSALAGACAESSKGAAARIAASEAADFTASGSYLAARHAGRNRDAGAAGRFYREALRHDPKNADLLDRTFVSLVVGGDIGSAVTYADRVIKADKDDRVGRLVLGVHALKEKQYAVARRNLAQSVRGPITDLTATLLGAWAQAGAGDAKGAVASIDRLAGPDWYAIFKDLHAGMILDMAGNAEEAGKRFAQAYKLDSSALRVVEAYGGWLSRNGKKDEARKVFTDFDKVLPNHPLIVQALAHLAAEPAKVAVETPPPPPKLSVERLLLRGAKGDDVKALQARLGVPDDGVFGPKTQRSVREFQERNGLRADGVVGAKTLAKINGAEGKTQTAAQRDSGGLPLVVTTAQAGAGEALYGLGASLGRRGGEDLGLVYLQLSLYLVDNHPLALLSLADLYEALKKPELALAAYERVSAASPLHRNAAIQMAANLDALERPDEAQKQLEALIAENPKDLEAIVALGNVLRGHKKFAECADAYSKAVDLIENPQKPNWVIFYFRGICYERSRQWPKAEADLKKALELFPEQAHVLNYLGYSWIDQGVRLDEGMDMIKRAVAQRPDDGYIVDSLGWAHYRLGNYEEAVKQLERAIELKPEDPTINDHLGDAYWRVGRELEARFQWAHARDLKPDVDELPKILAKIEKGLPEETSSQAKAGPKPEPDKKTGDGG